MLVTHQLQLRVRALLIFEFTVPGTQQTPQELDICMNDPFSERTYSLGSLLLRENGLTEISYCTNLQALKNK